VKQLTAETGLQGDTAEEALRRHLGVCLDLCHAAVEFEDPHAITARTDNAGIRIAKMQLSAGLQIPDRPARITRVSASPRCS
jgi:hypothetical protein